MRKFQLGFLDRKVSIHENISTQNSLGAIVETSRHVADVWGNFTYKQQKQDEVYESDQKTSINIIRLIINFRPIKSGINFITYDGDYYDILNVNEYIFNHFQIVRKRFLSLNLELKDNRHVSTI